MAADIHPFGQNPFWGSLEGFIPAVDPADLRSVWEMQREVQARSLGQLTAISAEFCNVRNGSAVVAISRTGLPIFPEKHLGQAPQGDSADQGYDAEQIPPFSAEMHDAETVQQCD